MLPIDLTNKVAVVTGATGELGRVISRTLARAGADVAIHYLRAEIQASGHRDIGVAGDITRAADVLALRDRVNAELGAPHIIVTNAVIQYDWKPHPLEQPLEDFESQFRSCVLQNVLMARAFVPAMIERRPGRVIAISTEYVMQCGPTMSAYVSGKRGMDGFLRTLARDIGPHQITVNQIAPGWTISDKYRAAGTERQPHYEQHVPLGRRGTDQEIANAVAFIASDLASFITGV